MITVLSFFIYSEVQLKIAILFQAFADENLQRRKITKHKQNVHLTLNL